LNFESSFLGLFFNLIIYFVQVPPVLSLC
jgi:hypothetical protein